MSSRKCQALQPLVIRVRDAGIEVLFVCHKLCLATV
jgi:hypothetical protein